MALSLRGVARRYGNVTGSFTVAQAIFSGNTTGSVSLRAKLESMARQEFSFNVRECIYDGKAAFQQIWSHVIVRIKLNPDTGITADAINALRTTWQAGIQNAWNNRWGCGRPGEATCPLTFEVQWVTSNEHHAVRVRPGPERSNTAIWDDNDTGAVAAHEFGHFLGNADEYTDTSCPSRNPVNSGTVMDNNSNNIPARLVQRFADNLGSNVIAI